MKDPLSPSLINFDLPDGATIYAEYYPNPTTDECIVFLNGLTQSTASWLWYRQYFGKEYSVLLPDFIFQGKSSKNSPYRDFNGHAADIMALIQSLGLKKVHLVGISYGAMVAQHLLVNYPKFFSSAVLMSSFARKTTYYNAIAASWESALNTGGFPLLFDVMIPWVLGEKFLANPLFNINELKKLRIQDNAFGQAIGQLMQATAERPDYLDDLRQINSPVLVLAGEKDILFPVHLVKEVADSIPEAEFVVIADAGHSLNVEAVAETIAQIEKFILKNRGKDWE